MRQPAVNGAARRPTGMQIVLLVGALLVALVLGKEALGANHATAAAAAPSTAQHHSSPSVRGTITAIDGDRWTVLDAGGTPTTVLLGPQTAFGTQHKVATRDQFSLGSSVAVTGPLSGATMSAERVIAAAPASTPSPAPTSSTPPAPAPAAPAPAPAAGAGAGATIATQCSAGSGLTQALSYANSRDEQAAVAVFDTATNTYSEVGDATAPYSSASVVKVFIATDLLLTDQMTGDTASTAYQMITTSDDDGADALYGLVGGDSVITTIANHYGIADLGSPPADTGQWGETQITADGLVHLYAKLKADPQVWPWLSNAMRNTTEDGTDGTDQFFGIPSASDDWAVKQGWMTGLGPGSTYDSTGYVDGDRYAVVILSYGSVEQYGQYMSNTITQMAKDILPGGAPAGSASCPA